MSCVACMTDTQLPASLYGAVWLAAAAKSVLLACEHAQSCLLHKLTGFMPLQCTR